MAGDDEKDKAAQAASGEPRKVDRREVLKGLSTVPALGLFAYAWQSQRAFQEARVEEAAAAAQAPAGVQEINVALLGAGAQGQVLTEAMLRIPGLRFRAVCDVWTEYNQKRVVNSLKRFKHEVKRCGGVSSSDVVPLGKFARAETKASGIPPHEAAEDYFKLALDCGIWLSYAKSIQASVKSIRPRL